MTIKWVPKHLVVTMHALLIEEHGGLSGAHNEQGLESSLARAENLHAHSEKGVSLEELAAAYGYGLARNHCFTDGNKRIALATIDVFLQINGHELIVSEPEVVSVILELAAGEMDEKELANWIGNNIQKLTHP